MFERIKVLEKNELKNKSIQELRLLGKGIGVKSPTLMTKEELVDSIIDYLLGNAEPIEDEYFTESKISFLYKEGGEGAICNARVASPVTPYDAGNYLQRGIAKIDNNKLEIVDVNFNLNNAVVCEQEDVVEDFCLKTGDIVDYLFVCDEVEVIGLNGRQEIEQSIRPDFRDLKIVVPKTKFVVNKEVDAIAPIAVGSRTIVNGESDKLVKYTDDIVKDLSTNIPDAVVIAFTKDVTEEREQEMCKYCDLVFNITEADKKDYSKKRVLLLAEHIKREIENRQNVVVYISAENSFKNNVSDSENCIELVEKILQLGGNYSNGGSLTTILALNGDVDAQNLFAMATNVCYVDVSRQRLFIDATRCETLFTEHFLTLQEIEDNKKLKEEWQNFNPTQKADYFKN